MGGKAQAILDAVEDALVQAVRDGAAAKQSSYRMARDLGLTPGRIKSIASRNGITLTASPGWEKGRSRAGQPVGRKKKQTEKTSV